MKMVVISADEYEKLKNEKKESETKIEAYKQCASGYESRIKRLTEELENSEDEITNLKDLIGSLKSDRMSKNETIEKLDKELDELKGKYSSAIAKKVLNSVYGTEQDICCRISKNLNASMFDKITELSNENEKLKKESAEKSEWLKAKNAALDNRILAYNKLEVKISSLETQFEEYKYMHENKMKELRQKYEAVLKANEKLAAENSRFANDPETTKLNKELTALKKQYRDLNNAYKSQRNELFKLKNNPDYKYDILFERYNCLYTDYELAKMVIDDYKKKIYEIQSLANV